jgi:hypothetical protein
MHYAIIMRLTHRLGCGSPSVIWSRGKGSSCNNEDDSADCHTWPYLGVIPPHTMLAQHIDWLMTNTMMHVNRSEHSNGFVAGFGSARGTLLES